MVKVSISLPNNTQITFESEEAEVLHDVVGMVLRDLPRDLMAAPSATMSAAPLQNTLQPVAVAEEKSTSVAVSALTAAVATAPEPAPQVAAPVAAEAAVPPAVHSPALPAPATAPEPPAPTNGNGNGNGHANGNGHDTIEMPTKLLSEEGRESFVAFCHSANPLGDMRRVVVAAEGASRHFELDGVNADDLGLLFDMAGWRRPGNFTQTLRNAARSKFGWLERIPGRSGRYAATALGLEKTING